MLSKLNKNIRNSIQVQQTILKDTQLLTNLSQMAQAVVLSYQNEGKVLFCGNGGSAADADHLAAELAGRYYYDRPPLDAQALHSNGAYLTAIANDYSYDYVYARLLQAVAKKGDLLFALSTSGNSANVVQAVRLAPTLGVKVFGFTGATGGQLKTLCDICISIPSQDVPRIQETYMLLIHTICEYVEAELFRKS